MPSLPTPAATETIQKLGKTAGVAEAANSFGIGSKGRSPRPSALFLVSAALNRRSEVCGRLL